MSTEPTGDLYLKFPDEATATAVFDALPEPYTGAVDVIGTIHKPTGAMLQTEHGPVPELAPLPGWHVNTRGPMPPELLAWAVQPANPTRVWA